MSSQKSSKSSKASISSVIIGIDVSSTKLDVCIKTDGFKFLQVANSKNGIEKLIREIEKISKNTGKTVAKSATNLPNSNITIVLEATGSYHWQASLMLKNEHFKIKVINPLITKKYERASIRGNKTDKIDAQRLTEIAVIEGVHNLPDFSDSKESLTAKQYQSQLKKLNEVKQELEASFKKAEKMALELGLDNDLNCIKQALKGIKEAKKEIEKKLTEKASYLAKDLSEKTKGLSLLQATILTNAITAKEFKNRDQITAFFGLDIKKRESGNWQGRERLSKRGNPFYRQILFQIGWSLKVHNETYKKYYQKQKEEKQKHYYTAILATARKFLRYFFKELKAYQKEKVGLNPSFT